ncbi:uncharacterized protein FA14DRAFT_64454 [Meira miltonrushii]|uniref:Uncharacterized protein n=1 Tax=Meira miltonrushii TaxID=1280837 RepID=A0A316V867_9BASI|nr:uncharacterized protein FA14DRAFT_64454 [Meira miltonrushii]PWN33672.1 hypothetical protein FA14DRAFT_64454 [Meira miltonrushii]
MASPNFAGSPNTVKFEHLTPSAATPRVSISVPAADLSGSTTPRPSIGTGENAIIQQNGELSSNGRSTNAIPQKPASLFDPSHLPSIYGRIQKISNLIVQASEDANSLSVKDAGGAAASTSNQALDNDQFNTLDQDSSSGPAPNIALGATTDDDVNSGYETALSMSVGQEDRGRNAQPTDLAKSIVSESVALRQAFVQAQRAIDTFEGGDMDIEEQEHLISLLEQYGGEQKQIRHSFIEQKDSRMIDA